MSTAILPARMDAMKSMPTDELKQELARTLAATAQDLAYLAAVWSELEARGEDLSDLRRGLGVYLPMIASGRLDPECVVKFAGSKMILQAVSTLPLPMQAELAAGREVEIVDIVNGKIVMSKQPVDAIKTALIPRVFNTSEGRLRPPSEQAEALENKRTWARRKRLSISLTAGEDRDIKRAAAEVGLDADEWSRRVLVERARPLD